MIKNYFLFFYLRTKTEGLSNWWALRGLRKENSPVEDFLTKGEHLLVLRQVTTMPTKRYKWSDRSELEFDTQTLTSQKNSLREFEPIIWIQKKPQD